MPPPPASSFGTVGTRRAGTPSETRRLGPRCWDDGCPDRLAAAPCRTGRGRQHVALTETNQATGPHLKSDISIPTSLGSAIVFGHADADGHLAAEQTRDYLVQRGLSVTTVVSSKTHNYRFWEKLSEFDLSDYGLVVFVDIAFKFRDPSDSLARLLVVSDQELHKQFIAIDHHPLVAPRSPRQNVRLIEVSDPYDCCLGVPELDRMQVAALCDGSSTTVTPTPLLRRRALGVRRAAADVGGVAGDRLLELIRERRWDFFEALADEDHEMHRSARGFRRRCSQTSPLLEQARSHSP